ncbi:MAG: glycerol-3-phosphate dehydrogenase/oxidase [Chloroflexota bacterium]|nr:glycerol-3-phosphate dehydrogenase/oxidase [Anaerolineales bacterium]
MNRSEVFSVLKNNPEVSVLIIGGGINGIGAFRDLALNGVDVLLVERGDFCSGASAASSRLAHGEFSHLAEGEIRFVRDAVRERDRLLQNAPHIVKPFPVVLPLFKRLSGLFNAPRKFFGMPDKPAERGAAAVKLDLMIYDTYTGSPRVVPRHQFLSRNKSLAKWKYLSAKILDTAVYYEGAILQPERLGIELILDAEAENPNAHALNYVSMVGGTGDTIILRDELTDNNYDVRPKLVINAAGPWIDFTNRKLGLSTSYIGGVKGSHIVVRQEELRSAIGESGFFFENEDGRVVFICPLYDCVLIGTSEFPVEHPDEAYCSEEEIDYFLKLTRRIFPSLNLSAEDIVFQFSGVRPLPRAAGKAVPPESRDRSIEVLSGAWTNLHYPVYSLVGGKWTSFRLFAEQVTDKALAYLGLPRQKDTRSLPIGGGRGYPINAEEVRRHIESLSAWTGVGRERLKLLFDRYGTRAEAFATYLNDGTDFPVKELPDFSLREIVFLVQHEKIYHVDDFLLRRSPFALLGRVNRVMVDELTKALGYALGWNEARKVAEVQRTLSILADRHGLKL